MHKLELIYGSHNPQPAKQSSIFVLSCETVSLRILVSRVGSADLDKHTLKTVRSKREKKLFVALSTSCFSDLSKFSLSKVEVV